MLKRYPLQFKINDIDYIANLLDVDLLELLSIFQAGFNPESPATLIGREKLREAEKFLNESGVTPMLPDLTKYSDLSDRMNLFKAVGAVQLISLKDTNPDWENVVTPDQVKLIDEYIAGEKLDTIAD